MKIGTRASPLALWQANFVADLLSPLIAPRLIEIVHIQTEGDRDQSASLTQIGGQGVFTKEIQRALLDGRVDVAVHSLKDLPTQLIPGLALAAVPRRGPVGDVLIAPRFKRFDELPQQARIATGSLRRRAQALHRRPDLELVDIRGNVESRLRKLHDDNFDGLILAQAGIVRLGMEQIVTEFLDLEWMLPAVGQGALGIECRANDADTCFSLALIDHLESRRAVEAERSLLHHLGGGCQAPIGAIATVNGNMLTLRAAILANNGSQRRFGRESGLVADAVEIGRRLADQLGAA